VEALQSTPSKQSLGDDKPHAPADIVKLIPRHNNLSNKIRCGLIGVVPPPPPPLPVDDCEDIEEDWFGF